jgi:heme/copper-type cytochrome/quinol oxidase subunit 3
MTAPEYTIDVSGLRVHEVSSEAPLWWGQVLLCALEGSMFFTLIAIYLYLRLTVDVWPPPGIEPMRVGGPTVALLLLLLSAVGSYMGSEAAKRNDRRGMIAGLGLNFVLGTAFLILRAREWRQFNFNWAADVHGSIVWSMLFLHTFDAAADLVFTLVLILILLRGRYDERQRLGVHVDSVVWYFIVLIWLPMYALIYWGPRFMGNT